MVSLVSHNPQLPRNEQSLAQSLPVLRLFCVTSGRCGRHGANSHPDRLRFDGQWHGKKYLWPRVPPFFAGRVGAWLRRAGLEAVSNIQSVMLLVQLIARVDGDLIN